MTAWRVAHIGYEGDQAVIGGLPVWKNKWRSLGPTVVDLPHPAYPNQIHGFRIFEIGDPAKPMRFAAAELSAGVFGFYVPQNSN